MHTYIQPQKYTHTYIYAHTHAHRYMHIHTPCSYTYTHKHIHRVTDLRVGEGLVGKEEEMSRRGREIRR